FAVRGLAAVQRDRGALFLADVQITGDAIQVFARNDRAHVHGRAAVGRADGHLAGAFAQTFDERIGDRPDRHGDAAGHAPLTGATEGGRLDRLRGLLQVGVGHDDQVILRAAGRLDAFAV